MTQRPWLLWMLLGVMVAPMASARVAAAQDARERESPPSIRVVGEATRRVQPDQAEIEIGVVTQAKTAELAARRNAEKLDATLAALRQALGPGDEVRTSGYSLRPDYRYPPDGGTPTLTGFTASNVVHVTMADLSQVGGLIDLATASGANQIQQLRFTLKDELEARASALREGVARGRAKAEAIASALEVRIVRVLRVEESPGVTQPYFANSMLRAESDARQTPIEPGTVEVRVVVQIDFEIAK